MKLKKSEFAKRLSPHTRGWLDAKDWKHILPIIKTVIGEVLSEGMYDSIQTDIGEFSLVENKQEKVWSPIIGKEVPVKHKYQVRCSCSNQFKELVNGGK
jgi:nucleoid DNA-binding protein